MKNIFIILIIPFMILNGCNNKVTIYKISCAEELNDMMEIHYQTDGTIIEFRDYKGNRSNRNQINALEEFLIEEFGSKKTGILKWIESSEKRCEELNE